jgi:glycyl-tRNA synthetase beta chain
MKTLLIEIGSEEIPSRFVPRGLDLLKKDLLQLLEKSFISYGTISEYATPRRLTLLIDDVAEKQEDRSIESLGPPKKAAFDTDGNPTKAAAGFARSLNIDITDLKIKQTDRGEYVCATLEEKGMRTADFLSQTLPDLISSLQLPKSMRWGNNSLKYFRPIQWILSLFGSEVIPFKVGPCKSSNISYGHRFLSPAAIKIVDATAYVQSLKQNHVYADLIERKSIIRESIKKLEASEGCIIHEDEELLDTVTNLVEYPTAVLGRFEDKYLALPKELLITVMKSHQKYFSMENIKGNMMPSFVVVSNMNSSVSNTVKKGAERVLRARLEDARFYYADDQKKALWDHMEELKKVTFQEKLGTLYEKTERIASLASHISGLINADLKEKTQRASMLCKADLVTGVVGEFPELQGYMGMTYARNSGEDKDIASAIFEHYLPRFAGDSLPSGEIGTIVSIADKMDNISSFFYLDMIPSGSEDPFALRRQAAGIIHILQNRSDTLTLNSLIDESLKNLDASESRRKELTDKIIQFFIQRIENILLTEGHSNDIISAALEVKEFNMADIKQRIHSLSALKKEARFSGLLTAAKRVYNILSKTEPGHVNEGLLSEPTEKDLFNKAQSVRDELTLTDFHILFKLEKPINEFFDAVLVMDKDPLIKNNRLALLSTVRESFNLFGDFSKIVE